MVNARHGRSPARLLAADFEAVLLRELPLKRLLLLPASGGEPRELNLPAESYPYARSISWAPDSKSVIFFGMSGNRIYIQPIDGGEPRGIRIVPEDMHAPDGPLSMLPDGRIAFMARTSTSEVWVLKNLFASSRAAK
jgi:hypothetical protein